MPRLQAVPALRRHPFCQAATPTEAGDTQALRDVLRVVPVVEFVGARRGEVEEANRRPLGMASSWLPVRTILPLDETTEIPHLLAMSQTLLRPSPRVLFIPEKQPAKPNTRQLKVVSEYEPNGDQPTAIAELVSGVRSDERDQVLLGVTGSGKTFSMAKVIEAVQKPTLILAPNKTLAAQLYGEMKQFFPNNAVEYFVSYYDYYQPEAYVPRTDTYIEKDAQINEQIDRMRHAATQALLERNDVVIVASVSCIYGIGSVETYSRMVVKLETGGTIDRDTLARALGDLQYRRNDQAFQRGTFRLRGEIVDDFPSRYGA